MGSKARTEHGSVRFTVKEWADGSPWIMVEHEHQGMPALDKAFIGFGLPNRTSLDPAHRIADFMNNNLANVSLTLFDDHPLYSRGVKRATAPSE